MDNNECNCCLGNKNLHICPLENCSYTLCIECKNKINNKICPLCRRSTIENISIDIEDNISIDSDENISLEEDNRNYFLISMIKDRMIISFYKFYDFFIIFLNLFVKLLIFSFIFTIIILIGRYISFVLEIDRQDFWFKSKEPYSFLFFILFGLLGFLILFCSIGLLISCCCNNSEED
jgi:hypothetical protein